MTGSLRKLFFAWLLHLGAPFHLDVAPTNIQPGITDTLTVNCTFSYEPASNTTNLISLTLSIADSPQASFTQLATLDVYSSDQVSSSPSLNATASGHIDGVGESYLSAVWTNPTVQQVGIYLCEADGLDSTGQPSKISQTTEVNGKDLDISQLIGIIRDLQTQYDNLAKTVSTMETEISEKTSGLVNSLNRTVASYHSMKSEIVVDIAQIEEFENTTQERIERLKNGLFEISEAYNGSVYYLSKRLYMNADVAEAQCEVYGGYLAEIDDSDEHEFLKNFTGRFSGYDLILIGITDEPEEGHWEYRFSQQPIAYSDWGEYQPRMMRHDCAVLRMSDQWKMWSYPCYDYDAIFYRANYKRYLCEVPADE